jgi:hypothetical protein
MQALLCLSMIFSEIRLPLFGIMLYCVPAMPAFLTVVPQRSISVLT